MNLLMLLGVLSLAKMEESVLKASANADLAFKEKHVKSKPHRLAEILLCGGLLHLLALLE